MVIRTPEPAVPYRIAAARVRTAAAIEQIARDVKGYRYHATLDDPAMRRKILGPMPGASAFHNAIDNGTTPDDAKWTISTYTVPVLRPDQEYHLFRRMNFHKHRAARAIEHLRPTFGDLQAARQVVTMCRAWLRAATDDRNLIANANMRIAARLAGQAVSATGDRHEDTAISACQESLLACIRSFDWASGNKFSTYCYVSIRRNVWKRIKREKRNELRPIEDTSSVPDLSSTDETANPTAGSERLAGILEAAALSGKELAVVTLYHGLAGSPHTHKQIGDLHGLTKEWSRQTLLRAVAKMRAAAGVVVA